MAALSGKQIKVATLLAQGVACGEAAKEVGVTPQTISAWKKDAEFEASVNRMKWAILEEGRDMLRNAIPGAVKTLLELATSAKSEEVRRKATLDILQAVGLIGDVETIQALYGWGCGPETAEQVLRQRGKKDGGGSISDLLKEMGYELNV